MSDITFGILNKVIKYSNL